MIPRVFGRSGDTLHFEGAAYDFGHRIAAIEFSLDGGRHWTSYETPQTNDYQNVAWAFDWRADAPGFYVLQVRSVNDAGAASPASAHAEIAIED